MTTPLSGALTIYELVGAEHKSFWRFEDLTHAQPLFHATRAYLSLLVTFWRAPTEETSSTAAITDLTIQVPSFEL